MYAQNNRIRKNLAPQDHFQMEPLQCDQCIGRKQINKANEKLKEKISRKLKSFIPIKEVKQYRGFRNTEILILSSPGDQNKKDGLTDIYAVLGDFFNENYLAYQHKEKLVDSSQPSDGKVASYRSGPVYWYGDL